MKTESSALKEQSGGYPMLVRVPSKAEAGWFDGLLDARHYLRGGSPVDDYLRRVVEMDGKPAALLVWGPAC